MSTSTLQTTPKPLTVWTTTNYGKFLKRWECQITLLASLGQEGGQEAGQEATVRTGHGTMDWFKTEKEYVKAVFCHPAYLTYMQSTS